MNGNPSYQFVDTNVLVYAHDLSAGAKHDRAKELVKELWQTGDGCLSIQILQELYVTLTSKVARPMAAETAAQLIEDLSVWKLHLPDAQDVLAAIGVQRRYGVSFWDAMIVQSAASLSCRRLWSEDLNPGQEYDGVKVMNPFAAS